MRRAGMAALLLVLTGGCRGQSLRTDGGPPEAQPEQEVAPARRISAGPWLLQVRKQDLWVRSPSGDSEYALTRTGQVAATRPYGNELGWSGAAISPDGRQVAYVEYPETQKHETPGLWALLWVVNSDGSGRRMLLDLRQHAPIPGPFRAGPILWSSDGTRIAFTLESFKQTGPESAACPLSEVHAVEVSSGKAERLFVAPERGRLTPRGWSEQGTLSFSLFPCRPTAEAGKEGHFFEFKPGSGLRETHARGAASSDGAHTLLLPSTPEAGAPAALLDGRKVDVPSEVDTRLVRHVAWMKRQPVAYLTTYSGEARSCAFPLEPAPALFQANFDASRPGVQPRPGLGGLMVLAFSPDDAHVLAATVQQRSHEGSVCWPDTFDSLLVVDRVQFENSTTLTELSASSIRVDAPASKIGPELQGFVGWVR